jgi:threonine dehydratase
MARFQLSDIEAAARTIDPVFLNSPQFLCEPLSDACHAKVFVKLETANPIRSFKGRGADLLVQQANGPLVCASAGNFGQAMAYAARKYQLPVTVFASVHANPLKVARMRALGATIISEGQDFDAAKTTSRSFAKERKLRFVEDSLDVETAIGAGTIALELLASKETFDAMLVPIGNGALVNGMGIACKGSGSQTEIIGVQAKGAPAMVESWQQQKTISYPSIDTIADGIAVREPVLEALLDMRDALDDALLVSEAAIVAAMKLLFQTAGLVTEPSGAVGVAALLEHGARFQNKKVAVILCGSNLTPEQMQRWLF